MNAISYNFRGVARESLEAVLSELQVEFDWGILLAQEFTKAVKDPLPTHTESGLVIADTPTCGVRVPGIVISPILADLVTQEPIVCGTTVGAFLPHPVLGPTL